MAWYRSLYAPRTGGAYDSHHQTAGIAGRTRRRGRSRRAGSSPNGCGALAPYRGPPKAIRKYKLRTAAFRQALERKVTNFACAARCLAPAPLWECSADRDDIQNEYWCEAASPEREAGTKRLHAML